ncbi:LPS export ABC transporter periplasmic protein LptC [Psychromonas sp. MME2]|uniref:LPS export ABC transporter periplasmic protein LptC n=1 Tax=unclassified Psychromonas TaxID=2614957 RepID=UPI00339C0885
MNKRQSIPFIILLVAFLTWLYLKPQKELPETSKHQPSYIAYNVTNTHFDIAGRSDYKLYADKVINFNATNKTLFENPRVIIYARKTDDNVPSIWQLSSKKGVLYNQDTLTLNDDVWLKNLSLDQLVQTMHTQELTILLDKKEVTSDLFVNWTGPQMKQQGVGLWGSLESEEFVVKDKIETVYLNEKN